MGNKSEQLTYIRALPLLWLSIAFLIGIAAASLTAASIWLWLLLAGLAGAAIIGLRKRVSWLPQLALAAIGILFIGAARYEAAQPEIGPDDLAFYNDLGNWVEIRGLLEKPPVPKDGYIELLVGVADLILSDGSSQQVNGLLLARTEYGADFHYGDRILLSGELTTPAEYEDFSYREYLARQGVYSLMPFAVAEKLESGHGNLIWTSLYALRERGVEILYRLYPAREAALLAGILLGDESGISEKVKNAFNETGTRHIIAIPGFNISIIAGLFLALFGRWLGARRGAWAAGIGIALYALLAGADASVVRAAIMGILALVALQTGRQSFALNALGFSAAVMALVNPMVLWDIGFQLSFAATLGLVLYSEPLRLRTQQWLDAHLSAPWAKRLSRPVNEYLLLTVAAQITTLPILLYYFHRLSIFSLPANLLILPVQPALMVLGGLSALLGMVFQPFGQLAAYLGWVLAAYTIRIVEFFAGLPWSSQTLTSFPLYLMLVWFAILAAVSIPAIRARIKSIGFQPAIGLIILGALTIWIWNSALAAPDGKLHLTLLDLDGEALLIHTPEGRNLLINAGGSTNQLMDEISRLIPWAQRLDWVIVAGQRSDQIGSLSGTLERLSPVGIGWAVNGSSDSLAAIRDQANELEIPISDLQPGDTFDLGQGARVEIISLGRRGAVLILKWNKFEALLPLGLDFDQMEGLNFGNELGPVDLLMLADSGYLPVNPPEWIANLSPSFVWMPSNDEPFNQEMLDALGSIPTFQIAQNGWLQITTDGEQVWLEVARR